MDESAYDPWDAVTATVEAPPVTKAPPVTPTAKAPPAYAPLPTADAPWVKSKTSSSVGVSLGEWARPVPTPASGASSSGTQPIVPFAGNTQPLVKAAPKKQNAMAVPLPVGPIASASRDNDAMLSAHAGGGASTVSQLVAVGVRSGHASQNGAPSGVSSKAPSIAGDDGGAVWPLVNCSTQGCETIEKWSRMRSTRGPETNNWIYLCWLCLARDEGLQGTPVEIEAAARGIISETAGNIERKRQRTAAFSKAKLETKELYDAIGVTVDGRRLYQLTRNVFVDIFFGLADLLVLKPRAMEALEAEVGEHKQLVEELKVEKEPSRIRVLVIAIEKIAIKPDLIAYKNDRSESEQWAMIATAAYSDELTSTPGGGYFRFFFICQGGGGVWRCLRMVASKLWRKHIDAVGWVPKQRWYCSCEAKYRAKWGVVCEAYHPGMGLFYMRAPCPDEDVLDLMAMKCERDAPELQTPQALYDSLPTIHPSRTPLVSEISTNIFKVNSAEAFDEMPEFQ